MTNLYQHIIFMPEGEEIPPWKEITGGKRGDY
jgi:hypothetical protein